MSAKSSAGTIIGTGTFQASRTSPNCVTWRGVLLVEEGGTYRFWTGAPTPEGEKPDLKHMHGRRWRVTLQRGQKCWGLLSHGWPDEANCPCSAALPLKHGPYELTIEFVRCPPTDDDLEDAHAQRWGACLRRAPLRRVRVARGPLAAPGLRAARAAHRPAGGGPPGGPRYRLLRAVPDPAAPARHGRAGALGRGRRLRAPREPGHRGAIDESYFEGKRKKRSGKPEARCLGGELLG